MAWTADTSVAAGRDQVMDILTRPCAITHWAPIPFEVDGLQSDRLETGSRARVYGRLAGKEIAFDIEVHRAADGELRLVASGPYVELDVAYDVRDHDERSHINALIDVKGKGVLGRFVAKAVDGLLANGALTLALSQLAEAAENPHEFDFSPAALAA
jgi:hypothetical protein